VSSVANPQHSPKFPFFKLKTIGFISIKQQFAAFLSTAPLTLGLFSASHAHAQNPVPFKLQGTATWDNLLNAFDPTAGAAFDDGAGQAAHLGQFTATADLFALGPPNDAGDFPVVGTVTIVAANGDQLNTVYAGVLNVTGSGIVIYEFVGGDGRFTHATGMGLLEVQFDVGVGNEDVPMTSTWHGTIEY
jgi:hypothetical protein